MTATELKTTLHQQIDHIQKEEDLEDLLLTVNDFLNHRTGKSTESPELIAQLECALTSANAGRLVPNTEVMKKAKEWLTR
ncbi:hypothetical protein [Spirosoma montaniterrae]|uniref:Uncharacterized protein n=1 Tax=Spirosoma montaniterrae TaxID=1178516 RepID=A0A1P9WVW8_9BACT|nr:hypothetical protein [Spirosoma montaniterrae]AQG79470.1 hypothetical protein AWR27_09145 [Spirosoma montaniterrae]